MKFKEAISQDVDRADYTSIIQKGRDNQAQVLRYVQMNLFGDYNLPNRWHAIEALGRLAEAYAKDDDEVYRNVIRRALWAMNDESGNVPWSAPEMMAVIIKARPEQYQSFIPLLITNAFDNPMCHRGMLWSIGYLGQDHYETMVKFFDKVVPLLDSADGDICGYGIWALGVLGYKPLQEKLHSFIDDPRALMLYEQGEIQQVTVGQLAKRFLH